MPAVGCKPTVAMKTKNMQIHEDEEYANVATHSIV
jgi:hypothetical protein